RRRRGFRRVLACARRSLACARAGPGDAYRHRPCAARACRGNAARDGMTEARAEAASTAAPDCALCGSRNSELVHVGVRHAPGGGGGGGGGCGLFFQGPRPSEDELSGYYAEQYRADYEEPPIERRFLVDLEDARLRVERLLPLLDRDTSILEIGSG